MPAKAPVRKKTRTCKILAWVRKRFLKKKSVAATAESLAHLASEQLGIKVNANTMCRALLRANIRFKADALDPIPRHYSKVDLLKVRVDYLEKRLSKIEKAKKAAA